MKTYFHQISSLDSRYDMHKILRKSNSKVLCEIGVDHGWNLTNLCKSKPELFVAIDIWDHTPYYHFYDLGFHERNYLEVCRRSIEENRCILPMRIDSLKAKDLFHDEFFDFIYIDASHDFESASRNIVAWWPKLKHGGIMGGHDYFDGDKEIDNSKLRINEEGKTLLKFEVKSAVDNFVEYQKIEPSSFCVLKDKSGIDSWFLYKDG